MASKLFTFTFTCPLLVHALQTCITPFHSISDLSTLHRQMSTKCLLHEESRCGGHGRIHACMPVPVPLPRKPGRPRSSSGTRPAAAPHSMHGLRHNACAPCARVAVATRARSKHALPAPHASPAPAGKRCRGPSAARSDCLYGSCTAAITTNAAVHTPRPRKHTRNPRAHPPPWPPGWLECDDTGPTRPFRGVGASPPRLRAGCLVSFESGLTHARWRCQHGTCGAAAGLPPARMRNPEGQPSARAALARTARGALTEQPSTTAVTPQECCEPTAAAAVGHRRLLRIRPPPHLPTAASQEADHRGVGCRLHDPLQHSWSACMVS